MSAQLVSSLLALAINLASLSLWIVIARRYKGERFALVGLVLALIEAIVTVLMVLSDVGAAPRGVPFFVIVRMGAWTSGIALLLVARYYLAEQRLRQEQLRTEQTLRENEDLYRVVAETIADALFMIDGQSRILLANASAERLFGYARHELVGQSLTLIIPERLRAQHTSALARYLETGRRNVSWTGLELPGRHRDGSEIDLEVSFGEFARETGRVFVGTMRDITERKRAEQTVRQAQQESETANAELEAFSYSVAHDLRTPLRAIDGFSQALLEDCDDALGPEHRDHLRRVRAAAGRMAELIDDLLQLSRITRADLERKPVDLSSLADSIGGDLQRRQPERRVELVVGSDLAVSADARLLRIALTNLLDNAWKFTEKKPEARIEIGAQEQNGARVFFVKDDGAGFDASGAKRLFAPFQRYHRASEFDGTGIGLATVQRVIHRHGGRIWAESTPGRGATFYFTLPDSKV